VKILITGSSGMLGQALCDKLATEHDVTGIDIREKTETGGRKIDFLKIDITEKEPITQKIKEVSPDIVIHSAAYTDVDGCEKNENIARRLNAEAVKYISFAANQCGCFLIYISTDYIFDGEKKSPYTEEDVPNPVSIYGKTKLEGEIAVKETSNKYLIIRTSWLFGEGGKNFVETIIEKAKNNNELKVVEDQRGSPTYSNDLAQAIEFIVRDHKVESGQQKILNITNSGACSWYEYAKEVFSLAGIKNAKVIPITSQELNRPAQRPAMSVLDTSKFKKEYGRDLPCWEDALARYLKERKQS